MRRENPSFDAPIAGLGSQENPWLRPSGHGTWGTTVNGKHEPAYGAWCKCALCGRVERSTFIFDFYPLKMNDGLKCESCMMGEIGGSATTAVIRELEKQKP
jgi:hypothetical protein